MADSSSHLVRRGCRAILSALVLSSAPTLAAAQYYTPPQAASAQGHQPGGAGLDLGLRQGAYTSIGAGIGQVGAGLGAGAGLQGAGVGVATGVGPLGGTADAGVGTNGFGMQGSVGWGRQTGGAFDGGVSRDGIGLGGRAELLGVGTGGSIGVSDHGPDLGASLAFGPLGTLRLGSHAFGPAKDYPGADAGYQGLQPGAASAYYTPRAYGTAPYYPPALAQQAAQPCPVGWSCQ